jgi:hypothetical protein
MLNHGAAVDDSAEVTQSLQIVGTSAGRSLCTLLRERRRALHARIAETLEDQFAEIAESQPELLARHCTEAGLIEKAAAL